MVLLVFLLSPSCHVVANDEGNLGDGVLSAQFADADLVWFSGLFLLGWGVSKPSLSV